MSDACDHPDVRPYGNPDPHGGRVHGDVPRYVSVDAECRECGESVTVTYLFDGIVGEPP